MIAMWSAVGGTKSIYIRTYDEFLNDDPYINMQL